MITPAFIRAVLASMLVLVAAAAGQPPRASADGVAHIGVATRRGLPATLDADLLEALRTRYDVTRIGIAAGRRPLAALRARAAQAGVSLVLLASKRGNMLSLAYHDAQSGKRVGVVRLYVRGPTLSARTREKVLAATERFIAPASSGQARVADRARARFANDALEPETPAADQGQGPTRSSDALEMAAPDQSAVAEPALEELADPSGEPPASETEDVAPEESTPAIAAEDRLEFTVVGGVGANMQSVSLRNQGTSSRLDAGPALALGLGARLAVGARDAPHLWIEGRYMTSLERRVDELHMGGAAQPMSLRTQRLEGGLGPRVPLGARFSLTSTLGYALRSVAPEVHFQLIPFYTLGGPYLRVELGGELFDSGVGLRFSPELQWLPQASTRVGGSRLTSRFALAGQLTLFLHLSETVDVEAFLHQSHALGSSAGIEVTDMERFVLATVAWRP